MKRREKLIQQKEWQIKVLSRKIAQVATIIAELERLSSSLNYEIKVDEDRKGIYDPAFIAYPTFAKAARQRFYNLNHSIAKFHEQLVDLKAAHVEAIEMVASMKQLDEKGYRRNASNSLQQVGASAAPMAPTSI